MKNKTNYIVFGVILIFLASIGFCQAENLTIEIERLPLKYFFNGEQKVVTDNDEGFIYRDKTYVPLRFIAESLDKNVIWDGDSNSIMINNKDIENSNDSQYSYSVEDGKLYQRTEMKVSTLKCYSDMLTVIKENGGDESKTDIIGVYGHQLFFEVLSYIKDSNVEYDEAIYRYDLYDNTYEFIEYAPILSGGYGTSIKGNKLVIDKVDYLLIYLIDTKQKILKSEIGRLYQLTIDGDYMYFFTHEDQNQGRYILYKQKIGEEKINKLIELPFSGCLKIMDGWIYCQTTGSGLKICKFKVDGTEIMTSNLLEMNYTRYKADGSKVLF